MKLIRFAFLLICFTATLVLGEGGMTNLKEKALQGDAEAQFEYACALFAQAVKDNDLKNADSILYWFRKSSEQGFSKAQTNLGIYYYFGDLGVQSYEKAYQLFKQSGEQGDPAALYYQGLALQQGHGVEADFSKGFEYLMRAAKADMPEAQLAVARSYDEGKGIKRDLYQAVSWYARALKTGLQEEEPRKEAETRFQRLYYGTHFINEAGERRFFWFEMEKIKDDMGVP
jgi:TPR repeat protein